MPDGQTGAAAPSASGAPQTAAPAVLGAPSTVPSALSAAPPMGSPAVALSTTVTKAPISLVAAVSQQSRVVPAAMGSVVATVTPAQQLAKTPSVPRLPAPQVVAPKAQQTTTIQLPANFQIPPGTVLIRSSNGQLMLVSQQAIARAQSQMQNNTSARPSAPTSTPTVRICTVQNPGTQLIKKVIATPVKEVSQTTSSAISAVQRPVVQVSALNFCGKVGIYVQINKYSALAELGFNHIFDLCNQEMLENVKKCKNFLATLIKLASSGPQAPEMGQNVKNLVQNLLEAKIEPEEFTKKLYVELKSSPQPYLVPFLKKSMLALRQLMPNAQSFIQQCLQQQPPTQPAVSTGNSEVMTSSAAVTSSVVGTVSLQSGKPVLASPVSTVGTAALQTIKPISSTGIVTTGASFQTVKPVFTSAVGTSPLQTVKPVSSSGIVTIGTTPLKTVKPVFANTVSTVGTALQTVKPVLAPTASTAVLTTLQPVKSVSSPLLATTALQPAKPLFSSAMVTTATTSLQPGRPVIRTPISIKLAQPSSLLNQSVCTPQAIKVKQFVVQPSGGIVKQVTTPPQTSPSSWILCSIVACLYIFLGSILKQITLPGNKILSLQASPVEKNKIKENETTSFRDEDDINDVTSMAGVNLSEESACILAGNSEVVGTLIRSCTEEPLLSSDVLQKKILEIGKRHDIMELNSDVVNLISHATQERLRALLEKLTVIAQHRMMAYKLKEKYSMSSDTKAQLRFLEKLDHIEKQRRDEEEREMLLRAAKSRSNKEDPEQLRLKQKAKEMQQLELTQMQHKEANRTALAAIGPRKKRPLDSPNLTSGLEGLNGNAFASGSSGLGLTKQFLHPRVTRVCLRDLIFCMEQEREMKYSLALYRALLK
uniref:TATA-box binding protein associated factor 4b n=1 Tax=Sphenodon punctatus TaxID=8508 RepID=A0A8D0H1A2_SPHPU